ncbi:MAG: DMSO reductase [Alphaproteobacteria bacterium CG_4_10_14_0_2_um_filter_63_37]|nr:MAG: hypothetical protein AUJ55_13320 [Proteobacteria bacterium CG1_02_64_396]PJA25622.1 MAG: DMSO reductase [Alphaproteobacteria bacterium CG_4_10_14_0_2_um_filter_63_37]
MHPAFSVIFFTVFSGAGFGLVVWLVFADVLLGTLHPATGLVGMLVALGVISAGLISSTFHLGHPERAWRAMTRYKTSWLAREGVLAIAFYPFALIYTYSLYLGGTLWGDLAGAVAAVLAVVTVFATGMIYGCLKTIRQWNTSLVPVLYILNGLMLGGVAVVTLGGLGGGIDALGVLALGTLALIVLTALFKGIYWFWIGTMTHGSTLQTATGLRRGEVRLLDKGHTHPNFLMKEFGYQIARTHAAGLKIMVYVLAFIVPLVLLSVMMSKGFMVGAGIGMVAVALVGMLLERWLFFAEATHTVNLYYGKGC